MFTMVFKIGVSDKIKKLICNNFVFQFIGSCNSQIALLDVTKLFLKRKPNKYLNDEYQKLFIDKLI